LATGDPATPWRTWVAHHHLAAGRVLLLGPGDPALVADLLARGAAAVDVCPLDGSSAAPEGAVARRWQELPPGGYQLAFTGGLLHGLPAAALEALVAALAPRGVLAAEDWVATPASIRAARALAARFRGSGGWRGRLAEALLRTRRAAWLWRWRRRLLRSRAAVARLRRLEVLVDRPYGGGLVDDLVQRFRFDEADERQATLLELLTYVEQKLLQEGLLAPTHLALLLRKP
ncbi:MAG TPA: hypothetical protein VMT16_04715, partial [Thermoanaerobaculia bacterium]|nr:hypothetical protein [Thermoanaerobaculia bacterium]